MPGSSATAHLARIFGLARANSERQRAGVCTEPGVSADGAPRDEGSRIPSRSHGSSGPERSPASSQISCGIVPGLFTDEWIEAFDDAVRADRSLSEAAERLGMVIELHVTGTLAEGDRGGEQVYCVRLTSEEFGVRKGPSNDTTIGFRTDHATATAIATGSLSALTAMIDGRLKIKGDLHRVVGDHDVAHLGVVLAALQPGTKAAASA